MTSLNIQTTRLVSRRSWLALPVALVAGHLWAGDLMADDQKPVQDYSWTYLADTVMGGVSEGQADLQNRNGSTVLQLTGTVSTENRGGFIQVRTALPDGLPPAAIGIRLRVRGNGQQYFVHLRTTSTRLPWQYYQAPFDTSANWQIVDIPLDRFKASGSILPDQVKPEAIRSLGIVAYGRDHLADVSVQSIGTYATQ
jgi:hypothetical protein